MGRIATAARRWLRRKLAGVVSTAVGVLLLTQQFFLAGLMDLVVTVIVVATVWLGIRWVHD